MKTKSLLIAVAFTALLSGCSSTPEIYSAKAIEQLVVELKKVNKDYKIIEVRVSEKDKLTSEFGDVNLSLRNSDDKKFKQSLYFNSDIPNKEPEQELIDLSSKFPNIKLPQPVNVDDILKEKDNIEKYAEKAMTIIKEEFEDKYDFQSLTGLVFSADDEGKLKIKFSINVTEKGKSSRVEGKRMVTDYYEIQFKLDDNGNVVIVD